MKSLSMLIVSLAVLIAACGPDSPPEGSDPQATGEGETLDTSTSALESAYIPCGNSTSFSTWSWWGTTTLEMTNSDSSGNTSLRVMYQAGAGSPGYVDVRMTTPVKGQWGGFRVWVTPLGWTDAAGYHACLSWAPNPGAPALYVQAY